MSFCTSALLHFCILWATSARTFWEIFGDLNLPKCPSTLLHFCTSVFYVPRLQGHSRTLVCMISVHQSFGFWLNPPSPTCVFKLQFAWFLSVKVSRISVELCRTLSNYNLVALSRMSARVLKHLRTLPQPTISEHTRWGRETRTIPLVVSALGVGGLKPRRGKRVWFIRSIGPYHRNYGRPRALPVFLKGLRGST